MINEASLDKRFDQDEENLEKDYHRKDLKAQRAAVKTSLYDGSKKLKHSVPKGKRI